ncbi:hypothetical protein [Aspergillus lentulus narnavirus 1]|nr:hypothetical protein [Aspergillus lentulus narnavirus 1]
MSAFSTVVGRLGELSESELRQLYLIVGVRLGIQDGSSAPRGAGSGPNKTGRAKGKVPNAPGSRKAASKGNPQRKSQWETHPLYREYKRLKKVVETQAKERNVSFAAVDSPEREAYNQALSQWLEAKSSFRDRSGDKKEGEAEAASGKGKGKDGNRPPAAAAAAGPSNSDKVRATSWADEVQKAEEEQSSSSSEDEAMPEAPAPQPESSTPLKRGARNVSLSSRSTPPKKGGGGNSK